MLISSFFTHRYTTSCFTLSLPFAPCYMLLSLQHVPFFSCHSSPFCSLPHAACSLIATSCIFPATIERTSRSWFFFITALLLLQRCTRLLHHSTHLLHRFMLLLHHYTPASSLHTPASYSGLIIWLHSLSNGLWVHHPPQERPRSPVSSSTIAGVLSLQSVLIIHQNIPW